MKCHQVMTRNPICCEPMDSVSHAAHLMRQNDIGVLPVISDWRSKKLVGIVTDRDLVRRVLAEALDADATPVAEAMTTTVMACRADNDLSSAIGAMELDELKCLPILDGRDCIVGVISQADVQLVVDERSNIKKVFSQIPRAA